MRKKCGKQVVVRLFHTGVSLGVTLTLVFTDTELRRSLVEPSCLSYVIMFFLLLSFTLVMYWTTCIVDPGFVPIDKMTSSVSESSDDEEVTLQSKKTLANGVKLRKCGYCGIVQPLRARHCDDCGRCVHKFDHHCPWLDACVGEQNHKFFWLFLVSQLAIIIWALVITWNAITSKSDWEKWLTYNIVFLVDVLILFAGGLVVGCLFLLHTYIMIFNITTWELTAQARITYLRPLGEANPFNQGCPKNMQYFLCRLSVQQWEKLYNRWVSKNGSVSESDSPEFPVEIPASTRRTRGETCSDSSLV